MLLYMVLLLLVGLSWLAWWKVPDDWWEDLPDAVRWMFARPAGPQWRKPLLTAGLVALSLSMAQHLTGVVYGKLFHQFNRFTPEFHLLVGVNGLLCLFSLLTSILGKGFARLPILMASYLLLFFWGITQVA